jgi:hypothetical protein
MVIVVLILSAASGYRAAYELYDSTSGLGLALDPSSKTSLPYTRPILGDYTKWIVGFAAGSLICALASNGTFFTTVELLVELSDSFSSCPLLRRLQGPQGFWVHLLDWPIHHVPLLGHRNPSHHSARCHASGPYLRRDRYNVYLREFREYQ